MQRAILSLLCGSGIVLESTTAIAVANTRSTSGLDVPSGGSPHTSVVIENLGGSGYYNEVTNLEDTSSTGAGWNVCSATSGVRGCTREQLCVEDSMAPFNEALGIAFRGPLNIYNVAWYEGTAESDWGQTARWGGGNNRNVAWMKNDGDPNCDADWGPCHGSSQTYATSPTECSSSPSNAFDGRVEHTQEINLMSSSQCSANGGDNCGAIRGIGNRGFGGGADGSKAFVVEVDMPRCGTRGMNSCSHGQDIPAIWALNAKIFHSAQYGCNCHEGCGEFDIVETLGFAQPRDALITTAYDIKGTGSPGYSRYFARPTTYRATYMTIFKGGPNGYIQVAELDNFNFGSSTLTNSQRQSLRQQNEVEASIRNVYHMPCSNPVNLSPGGAPTPTTPRAAPTSPPVAPPTSPPVAPPTRPPVAPTPNRAPSPPTPTPPAPTPAATARPTPRPTSPVVTDDAQRGIATPDVCAGRGVCGVGTATCEIEPSCSSAGGFGCLDDGSLCRYCGFGRYPRCGGADELRTCNGVAACGIGGQTCEVDDTCAAGGLGCIRGPSNCRFCGFGNFLACSSGGGSTGGVGSAPRGVAPIGEDACSERCSRAEPCYTEARCATGQYSNGCNAHGHSECRFCGFGRFSDISCP